MYMGCLFSLWSPVSLLGGPGLKTCRFAFRRELNGCMDLVKLLLKVWIASESCQLGALPCCIQLRFQRVSKTSLRCFASLRTAGKAELIDFYMLSPILSYILGPSRGLPRKLNPSMFTCFEQHYLTC